jgi:hypothetical protein
MSKAKKLALLLALSFVFAFVASVALAASPDGATTATTVIDPTTGMSRWTYKDAYDSAAKTEGGYAAFDSGTLYTTNPHGGYDSTTNKCKVCHAVHRAEGAYFLLRSDTQDDACSYCHIGGSAHSRKIVYDLAGTIYTPNGHTIGASSIIPDSSVYQWLEEVELETVDEDGNPVTATVEVRRYYERRNKMFRFARHHGQSATADSNSRNGYGRIGPLALRCMNCHQPHNAVDMVWKPVAQSNYSSTVDYAWELPANPVRTSYKLLRAFPSASVNPTTSQVVISTADGFPANKTAWDVQIDRLSVWPIGSATGIRRTLAIRVPVDPTIGPNNTGLPKTIWTDWPETADHEFHGAVYRDPSVITQYALSVWCADCHNLNIGYWSEPEGADPMLFGFKSHADRTHPAPYAGAYNGPAQCYSCHRNDMPLNNANRGSSANYSSYLWSSTRDSCEQCHFGTYSYYGAHAANDAAGNYAYFDFPHSGDGNDIKMLGNWTANITTYTVDNTGAVISATHTQFTTAITSSNLDAVCKRCHPGIGVTH